MADESLERWRRASELFDEVRELDPASRAARLAAACGTDSDLIRLVEDLVAEARTGELPAGSPLSVAPSVVRRLARIAADRVRAFDASDSLTVPDTTLHAHDEIGPYRLLEKVGEGGMGEVWRAEQTRPIRREVALKVIKAGLDTKRVVTRFEVERQVLALMDHPAIAKVYEAGETPRGSPYFAMEYVAGEPVTGYCDRHRLGTQERLDLFARICEGVQHAHEKGVIHRDLKPSNVLVTLQGDRPVPKIIDFGVAKATMQRLTEKTLFTEHGVMIGTPSYMSPEQADLGGLNVDTRTDVYALGVMLYELLTGVLPFDAKTLREAGYEEIRRRIREVDPPKPSTRARKLGEDSEEIALRRGTDPAKLASRLRGDLDWIVMKCLEKDRVRRYASPNELAADLKRHLAHEPVAAGPPGAAYRTRKFVRRHRLGVAAAAIVVVSLVGAVVGTSTALVRARQAEGRARSEQERAQKASDFLSSTLQGMDAVGMAYDLAATLRSAGRPTAGGSEPGTASADPRFEELNLIDEMRSLLDEHVLDDAVERIEAELQGEPALAGDLYRAIGGGYSLADRRLVSLQRAVELSERARGPDDPVTLDAKMELANCCGWMEDYEQARVLVREVMETSRRVFGEDAPRTIEALGELGWTYQHEGQAWATLNDPMRRPLQPPWSDEAITLLRDALDRARRVLGDDDRLTLNVANNLALALGEAGEYAEAESLIRATIDRSARALGKYDSLTLDSRVTLVAVRYYSGRVDDAIAMMQELREELSRTEGKNGLLALTIEMKLGVLLLEQDRIDEAEPLLRDSARRLPLILGEAAQHTRECEQALARLERRKAESPPPTGP